MKPAIIALATLATVAAATAPAEAVRLSLDCKNPRQHYLVTFDTSARSMTVAAPGEQANYLPLAFERTAKRVAVSGMVGNGSDLGFYAEFQPHPHIDLYSDGKVFQTDPCR